MENYLNIVQHYEDCLEKFGDTHRGVDWPNKEDMEKRFQVMLEIQKFDPVPVNYPVSLLDFGCGTAQLLDYLHTNSPGNWDYSGLDISPKFIDVCQKKFPHTAFYCADVLKEPGIIPNADYIVMNGVFTEKRALSFEEMYSYFTRVMETTFPFANRGIAFNAMSTAVDWERDDLFHLPLDRLTKFLTTRLSRDFIIRNDYGLYEFTTYIYKAG